MKIDLRPVKREIRNHVWVRTLDEYYKYAPYRKKFRMIGEQACIHCGVLSSENNMNYSLLDYCNQINPRN